MNPRWRRIEELFHKAIELEPAARDAFLRRACGGDEALAAEVASLVEANEGATAFLEEPVAEASADGLWQQLARTAVQEHAGETVQIGSASPPSLEIEEIVPGTLIDGKYRVEALLGSGGMGAVFRATQLNLKRPVAIKVMRGEAARAPEALARFQREALAVARLKHPHIVAIHDLGISDRVGAYIVMEFLDGLSLGQVLQREGRIEPRRAIDLMRQISAAVHEAHTAGVLHRDLKPANVVVEPASAGPWVKVLDFGIAELMGTELATESSGSLAEQLVGTPHYMSPEQCEGRPLDVRSDVYALGCVLFELLVGRPPFGLERGSLVEVLRRHRKAQPPAPSRHAPGVPAALDRVVLRALSKSPDDRFATAAELGDALAAIVLDAPNNVPQALTPIVGREHEVAEVGRLSEHSRLVTLLGPAGIGKTRLALEVAAQSLDRYPDGVWLVELAPLVDPALVVQAVARTLSVRDEPDRPLVDTLRDALRKRRLLVVLDNCEHVVGTVARLVDACLKASPGLRVLATSREALGVVGEAVWHVPSLALPEGDGAVARDDLAQYESVRLFVDRAGLSRPGFALTDENAPAIGELVRRLEGIPLAIELAAARTRVLTVRQILEKMSDRFELLASGARTTLGRQRTLEAAIDWSYDLLTEAERDLFQRLSAFVGGWTIESASEVLSAESSVLSEESSPAQHSALSTQHSALGTQHSLLDLLERLVDKSLVRVQQHTTGARYAMLETIRQYGVRKLEASDAWQDALARHTAWAIRFVEPADAALQGPEARVWADRLEVEHDNLRAALLRTRRAGEVEQALRLCNALAYFWRIHGFTREGRRWIEETLEVAGAASEATRAHALNSAGMLAYYQGDLEDARRFLERSITLSGDQGDPERVARTLYNLGAITNALGEYDRAVELYEESIGRFRALGNLAAAGRAVNGLGLVALDRGDFDRAAGHFEELLAVARRADDLRGVAGALHNLGVTARRRGRHAEAERLLDECLCLARDLDDKQLVASSIYGIGTVALDRGDHATARERFGRALAMQRALGAKDGVLDALEGIACADATERPDRAIRFLGAAAARRDALGCRLHPSERACLDRLMEPARRTLDEHAAARAAEDGRGASFERILDEALSITESGLER